ncbi:ATPase [Thermoanaerobacterium aotearoense SCUT27]|uniref:ATPase n=3 Tax=Thermoanaerobacterium TaxID=28895 RepID=W9EEA6_9THEO|nr:ATPase associated with various cellular activities AAA_5 [Thermoanaerobacterium saccharolyticum JW/SL-YS485]ETO39576.1 ATPase [Thermoanaerobacterium aotearoense SCUT27]
MEAMHVVLKYNDSLYSVDTIEEHINVIKKKGKVIWGIIKPNENSPGIGRDKIKTINDQIQNGIETKAFFYNQGHIRGIGIISRFWDRDEMRNGQYIEFIPEYYRSDINKCVGGIELREITKIDDDSFERKNLYQHDRTERINFGNQVNPMYVFEKEPRSFFSKKGSDVIKNIEVKRDMENTYTTIKEQITNIKNYIRNRGFLYGDKLVENYYLSLKTKPFLILAGISGTGKSKLARLFAEAVGATTENGRFKLVPVRPDWSDFADLLGYKDLNGRFHPGVLTTFVKDAMKNPHYPYFFVLDEMNLARVEYYFSDVLSIIESRNKVNKTIVTDRLLNRELLDRDFFDEYGDIYIPDNLYFIGTVNMDETTFPFSKKVLDRANVIELSDVDLDYAFEDVEEVLPKNLNNDFLRSDFLTLKDCFGYDDIVDDTISILKNINEVLGYYRFGYRVRDEICFYIIYNSIYGLMDFDDAMDYEILQKILPRINGSSIGIKKILIELFKICSGNLENRFDYDSDESEKMFEEIANAKYRKSCEKIAFMIRRYEEDVFTSYWL